ncbi:MAG TPA: hypothetical protein VGU25_14735 [Acidobacteriaceae bacterium]|nr:hypothetical protein [Acidobacteriaceae bacterium]
MAWVLFALLQIVFMAHGIRQERAAGLWSWSKFFFAFAFGLAETAALVVPLTFVDPHGPHARYFVPVLVVASTVAALNFIWFIIICRRWKLPNGETSLQAYHDEHPKQP